MSRGADLLARWLDASGITTLALAEAANVTEFRVCVWLGHVGWSADPVPAADLAVLLDALTDGAVPANSWADPVELAARVAKARALLGLDPGPG